MEVHHPHQPTHKKKWPEYVLEFLMLFLAVYLGFVAENIREHQVENKRGEDYVSSLFQEIKKDVAQVEILQLNNEVTQQQCDGLLKLLSGKEIISDSYPAYKLWSNVIGFTDFVPNDGTIEQLKSSGGLRLIRKKHVVDKIIDYYKEIELIRIHQSVMNSYLLQPTAKPEIFNMLRLNNSVGGAPVPLLSRDEKEINRAYSYLVMWKGLLRVLDSEYFEAMKKKAKDLLRMIDSEYHLQDK